MSFFPVRAGLLPTAILMAQLPSMICGIILNRLSQKSLLAVQNCSIKTFHPLRDDEEEDVDVEDVVEEEEEEEEVAGDLECELVCSSTGEGGPFCPFGAASGVEVGVVVVEVPRITLRASLLAEKKHTTCTHEAPGTCTGPLSDKQTKQKVVRTM